MRSKELAELFWLEYHRQVLANEVGEQTLPPILPDD
jgi:hypothetical protein